MIRFQKVRPIKRLQAETALRSGKRKTICDALVRIAFHESDWQWVQTQCLDLLRHPDPEVRGTAATCLGHIVRIHKQLDLSLVQNALEQLTRDPEVGGRAQDALDDIQTYLKKR
ncbi:MAG: hypothetical protein HY400_03415 [Elusimicrobia bacterium]|nr:hypothetical protein [Elusimicrobiota bacterium]